ncbi:hypothetical protein Hypma_004172 [Hypsizygus marmoreus]|uniref:Uncharacterized protein n=1 Tax=Hypsizygus marmoreus TaxID=39966 RepID=A0A369J462_HYPMA|nr:hypothetical protein Hypma_004172 [Hypsizygus marmoreus]
MNLPPGLQYLTQALVLSFPSSFVVYLILSVLVKNLDLETAVPTWIVIVVALSSRPLFLVASSFWSEYSNVVDAKRRGAALVPQVSDSWPGGFSIVAAMVKNFKTGHPGDIFLQWIEQYGNTYALKLFGENRVFTYEPEHIKAILATQFEIFEKGPIFNVQFSSLLGTGVFNSDGDMWKFHRTMTRPFFSKERISDFELFDRHAEDAINQANARLAEGHAIDFQDLVSRFTLDTATEFLCGTDVRSLSAGLPYPATTPSNVRTNIAQEAHPANVFAHAFISGQTLSSLRTRYGPSWALVEFWEDRVKPHREVVDAFLSPILEEALRTVERKKRVSDGDEGSDEGEKETLLDNLVSQTQNRQILKDELTNLLVAGRDTTASTLTFAIYMLTQHPDITKRLREEIFRTVGQTGRPTYEHIKEMKYLRAFVNETLRLYPPVPFDSRTSNKATVWPSKTPGVPDYYIPARTKCSYGVFLMHRRKDLWGPDALEFDPDRFLDERLGKYLTPNPFIFLPFNAGPRICLGQQVRGSPFLSPCPSFSILPFPSSLPDFHTYPTNPPRAIAQFAYHESSFFLVRLLQRFAHFTLAGDAQPPESLPPKEWGCDTNEKEGTSVNLRGRDRLWPGVHLTMFIKGGLWVRMQESEFDSGSESALGGDALGG